MKACTSVGVSEDVVDKAADLVTARFGQPVLVLHGRKLGNASLSRLEANLQVSVDIAARIAHARQRQRSDAGKEAKMTHGSTLLICRTPQPTPVASCVLTIHPPAMDPVNKTRSGRFFPIGPPGPRS